MGDAGRRCIPGGRSIGGSVRGRFRTAYLLFCFQIWLYSTFDVYLSGFAECTRFGSSVDTPQTPSLISATNCGPGTSPSAIPCYGVFSEMVT